MIALGAKMICLPYLKQHTHSDSWNSKNLNCFLLRFLC